ncbi:transcription initiation factor TFIID subunit 9-like [Scaptodrosophila lebanonensis]|uniref:Transcription initiation factor TFIID subunit 9-like n=1 Tax=Drosophila lebanonensis TaxID=7225 RepID=A0A6J2U465_DROLE|nr:transcription initiation factor TFIID subunit 9-like [Scaptodrosophila lebanonensis]
MAEKNNVEAQNVQKDEMIIKNMLKEQNVMEYEPHVVTQMLEFAYGYLTEILSDAKAYSVHASKTTIDLDDMKLAINIMMDKSFTEPSPRHVLVETTRQFNVEILPIPKPQFGLRLPPLHHCQVGPNFNLRPTDPRPTPNKNIVVNKPPPLALRKDCTVFLKPQAPRKPLVAKKVESGNNGSRNMELARTPVTSAMSMQVAKKPVINIPKSQVARKLTIDVSQMQAARAAIMQVPRTYRDAPKKRKNQKDQ